MPTTPNGTVWTSRTFSLPNAEQGVWACADSVVGDSDVPVILYAHGNEGPYNQFTTLSAWASMRNWLIDNGWAWVESAGGGLSSWGNAAARQSYEQAFSYLRNQIDIGSVVVLGRSMGGLVSYWLYRQSEVVSPHAVGLIVNSGTTNLTARIGSPPGVESIRMAHGLSSNGSGWDAHFADYDPMRNAVELWEGASVLQLYGDADTTVAPATHAQAWLAKYSEACDLLRIDVRAGGDHSAGNGSYHQVSAMSDFLVAVTSGPGEVAGTYVEATGAYLYLERNLYELKLAAS